MTEDLKKTTTSRDLLAKEMAERKRAEERIEHLNFVLYAIRKVNQLIVREEDRDRLLQGVCDQLIENRGYYNAWIVLQNENGESITTAESGLGKDFLPMIERLNRGELTDCGRKAIKQSGVVVTEDPLSVCANCPLSGKYAGKGAMTVRLAHGEKIYGLVSVSIPAHFSTDEEEQALFGEVADDIAFALHNMELEEERKRAEEKRKKLEAQLQQSQKMEAIGSLAGGIAHDFNNILSLIIGYTELALDDVPEGTPVRDNINEAYKAGKRARDLVKQILTFSRQSESERKPVKIHLIVTETLKLIRSSLPTTIEIRENITTTGMALVDPMQIEQVIMNLSTNAYCAMRETGGLLEVSLHNVECGMRPSEIGSTFHGAGNADLKEDERRSKIQIPKSQIDLDSGPYLRLTVSDSGHGIEKKNINRIFEPYYTTKEKSGGTGMGLAIVHGIVKGYGGAITVESEPGNGTKFHVFLPRIEAAEGMVEPEEIIPLPIGKERILFVDDEPGMINIGKRMLERLGYKVVARTSSIEALEAFRAQPDKFDLVITDMTMPNITGDELARKLMGIRCDIPIILCTGFSERITEEKAKAMGIRKLIMKPIVMAEMAKAVRGVLDA